ncbi:hypothetical protein EWB00_008950, partial [Schistosoma japonicum]
LLVQFDGWVTCIVNVSSSRQTSFTYLNHNALLILWTVVHKLYLSWICDYYLASATNNLIPKNQGNSIVLALNLCSHVLLYVHGPNPHSVVWDCHLIAFLTNGWCCVKVDNMACLLTSDNSGTPSLEVINILYSNTTGWVRACSEQSRELLTSSGVFTVKYERCGKECRWSPMALNGCSYMSQINRTYKSLPQDGNLLDPDYSIYIRSSRPLLLPRRG